ncbi:uncharacterized protein LOC121371222 isoform X1 [Gigantopelta aegis]|uniref:uncharacterized protein LOC121371222 isoform X1 n=1 Tax=Gigantopelta aegis TaxID=1735272 RepID=UPI001B88C78C|nr:uncharacterized protein LOC121371222 isoform X1 [Gigantopelta aegis]
MTDVFNGFELLLFRRFQSCPALWLDWRGKLLSKAVDKPAGQGTYHVLEDLEDIGEIPQSLWYLSVTLHRRQRPLLQLMEQELQREKENRLPQAGETLLSRYLSCHQFTEFYLDSMFKYGDDNRLPREIFKCPNVKYLSLKYNSLDHIPADIGRMSKLEYLALTNNKLQVHSLPHTLIFCKNLKTVLLDNNLLDALPGFLLQMPSIETVHRHGNHNYFKATFMWYHTDVNYRIIPIAGSMDPMFHHQYESLQFWAAKTLIGFKKDFFSDERVAHGLKDYIADIYDMFHICHYCNKACLAHLHGYKVITFKNPYLGNTCVPFQHWACSKECAEKLEVPARKEQIAAAMKLDEKYDEYVNECQLHFHSHRTRLPCGAKTMYDECQPPSQHLDESSAQNTPKKKHSTRCVCVVS